MRQIAALLMLLVLAACGSTAEQAAAPTASTKAPEATSPRVVEAGTPLQCVPYARKISKVALRGDAWTWWQAAAGRYRRSRLPEVGSVMVLARSARLRLGHLAVVTAIRGPREIVVRHANWLNRGRIHLDTPVIDVSAANDWSRVRVWYTPGRTLGRRRYAVEGFILPHPVQAAGRGFGS